MPSGLASPNDALGTPLAAVSQRVGGGLILAGWFMFALVVANAAVFLWRSENPLLISDAWYFLDAVISKAASGTLALGDFFAKRNGVDHSLPLHKLLMVANYRYFDLDLALDASVGMLFAIATLVLIRRAMRKSAGAVFARWPMQAAFVAIAAVYLSLNATAIFEWPLLTMGFALQFFFVVLFVASWSACAHGRYVALLMSAAASLVTADGGGVIAVIAAIFALALLAAKGWQWRRALLSMVLLSATIIVYKIAYEVFAPPYTKMPLSAGLLGVFADPNALAHVAAWARMVLSASVVLPTQAESIFGRAADEVTALLAVFLALAHAWFWWQACRRRPTLAGHTAVCLMLLFYGFCAGVLLARVPTFGDAAFSQPRYVLTYQLNLVALLMMAANSFSEVADHRRARLGAGVLATMTLALVLVQIPLTMSGWKREPYQRIYVEHLALQMQELAAHPESPPKDCLPLLTVCQMPEVERRKLMVLLQEHQLNRFSPSFQRRHDLPLAQ